MSDQEQPLNGAQLQTLQNSFNAKLLQIKADIELRKRALDMAVEFASHPTAQVQNIVKLARDMHAFLIEPATTA